MLFTRWWISLTEELLELAYRNGSQCNRNVTDTFELRLPNLVLWLKADVSNAPAAAPRSAIFGKLKG